MIENGTAPYIPQWEGGATYDQLWQDKNIAQVRGGECEREGVRVSEGYLLQ